MSSNLENLTWKDNSRKMYEAILNGVPFLFVGGVKRNIAEWIKRNNISIVTEDIVFMAVDDIAPEKLANGKIKPELEKLRTK